MFSTAGAFTGMSVDNIDAAQAFYSDTLGMTVKTNEMGILELHLASGARTIVYPKPNHQPATYTVLNFEVDDVEAAVDDLNSRGVEMIRYEGTPHDEKGIVRGWGPDIAWFTDPAGNILSVLKGSPVQ